jgi:HTH-type transcriptional regulator / antitoxin MqsA
MKCPACSAAELVRDTRDLTHTYKSEITTIPDVTVQFCPACDEAVLDAGGSARVSAAMLDFNKQVAKRAQDAAAS